MADEHQHAFWTNAEVERWVHDFCSNDRSVTVFVGAGASMEVGLPSWRGLLESLLDNVAGDLGIDDAMTVPFRSAVLDAEGLMAAAEVARASLGAKFESAALNTLYETRPDPLPGPTAQAVARLYKALDGRCEIATLNYDHLLEAALVETAGYSRDQVDAVADGDQHLDRVVVRHLHGARRPPARTEGFADVGHFVLSERDYLLPKSGWQEDWVLGRLLQSQCVFVGIGMSDLNILRYLYRSQTLRGPDSPTHFAILRRSNATTEEERSVRQARELASELRWESSGVSPVWIDYFVQSAQLIHELVHRVVTEEGRYQYYRDRMLSWEREMANGALTTADDDVFVEKQDRTQAILHEAVAFVRELLEDDLGALADDEMLGMHLWVRDFSNRGLVQWCASDKAWRDPKAMVTVPISATAEWIAVHAFAQGTPVDAEIRSGASRWRFVRGYPIFLDDSVWGRLPVGVITLASTAAESSLAHDDLAPETTDDIFFFVHDTAADLLRPPLDATP